MKQLKGIETLVGFVLLYQCLTLLALKTVCIKLIQVETLTSSAESLVFYSKICMFIIFGQFKLSSVVALTM